MAASDVSLRFLESHRPARAVLVLGILSGLAVPTYFFGLATQTPLAWDFIAYYSAAEAYLSGNSFVGLVPPFGEGIYVYPPVVVLGFLPLTALDGWFNGYLVQSGLSLAMLMGLGVLCIRELKRLGVTLERLDKVLILGFTTLSLYPMVALGLGQVDPYVAVLVALLFLALEKREDVTAGLALALAAVIKLFPVALGVWLVRRRRWRAALICAGGTVAATLASIAIFGASVHRDYLTLITAERSRLSAFAEGVDPNFFDVTLVRPLAAFLPEVPPITYAVVAVAVVAPALVVVYRQLDTRIDRHVAFLATVTAVVIASPASNLNHLLYLYFPLVVTIYALDRPLPRGVLLVGLVVLLVPIQPIQLSETMTYAGIAPGTVAYVDALARRVLSTASIALIGSIVVLVGCVVSAAGVELPSTLGEGE